MMIHRISANKVLIAVVVAVFAAVAEGRLQGGAAGTTRATGGTHASTRVWGTANKSNNKKQLRAPARKLTEQEEDEILDKMEKEYQLEQASRQKANEHAMKSRNKILSDAGLLQELHALDAPLHDEELQHPKRAKEEKKQAEAKKQEHQSLVDVELKKSIQKLKEESSKYEAKMKLKKVVAAQDEKVIAAAKKATKAHQKAEEDRTKQIYEHTHGNDEKAVKDDEKRIMDMVLEEQKIQEEARKEKMEQEQKLQQQYERKNELERRTLELLMS